MKRETELQLRKYPRLSSFSSSSNQQVLCRSEPELSSTRSRNASAKVDVDEWALSLHVVDYHHHHQQQDQLPLQICLPEKEESNNSKSSSPSLFRRRSSSRFTNNKYKTSTPIQQTSSKPPKGSSNSPALLLTSQLGMRRSPRFCSSAPPLTLTTDHGMSNSINDGYSNVVSVADGSKKRRRFEEDSEEPAAGRVVRRSPRLNGESGNGNSADLQLLALPEPGTGSLSQKRLRSRTVLMRVDGSSYEKPKVGERSDVNGRSLRSRTISWPLLEFDAKGSAKEAAFNEKCLRASTVKMVVVNEKDKAGKSVSEKSTGDLGIALIKWHGVSQQRNVESAGLRRSSRLNESGVEIPKLQMLALPEKSISSSRSKAAKKQGGSTPKKRASGLRSDEEGLMTPKLVSVSENKDGEECVLGEVSEKRVRTRSIQFKVNLDESAEGKIDPIEGHLSKNKRNAKNTSTSLEKKEKQIVCSFVGDPIPEEVAQEKWQWRYELKRKRKGKSWKINADEDEVILNVDRHYAQAKVGNCILDIGDCVYVKGEGKKKHVGRILEFFKTMEGEDYFRVQWFFRAEDTVLKDVASFHDKRRLFYSTLMNDNILDCIISKVNIVKIPPELCLKSSPIKSAAFYYDMEYCVDYSTFRSLATETSSQSQSFSLNLKPPEEEQIILTPLDVLSNIESLKPKLALLDLFSGCGGMSTGLCLGAKLSGLDLVTKWAVDYNSAACESLKLNHPETQVRNEAAEDFLGLLRHWKRLCESYVCDLERTLKCELEDHDKNVSCNTQSNNEVSSGEYEVSSLVDICYGDPGEKGKRGLHFKVRWKGYSSDDDTWEPIEGLSNCQERVQDFVRNGFQRKILPLPGDADVICGGPPCQGISGYNRYRNFDSPLTDERNRQIIVFMDIVEFLKPKYVLMENVVDIIRFDGASLGRYALSRLVHMRYQARLGTMASGCYGLPQFRLRVFIWGAHPSETLPRFPLPTHDVVVRYWPPIEFERNIVAYDEGQPRTLQEAVVLRDSISDLPNVTNDEACGEMPYEKPPETEFQRYIRLSKGKMVGSASDSTEKEKTSVLYDHRPLQLSEHDYLRVCLIPRRKGANFRDLAGVVVGEDNVARRDPSKEPIMLPTGRPLVPECVLNFEQGKSRKPYARLWWDETVSTIVTFPYVRCQPVLHPEQDRILTVRECARLQGFPDYYRFCGTVKERYCQIGNAVSVPVGRGLGYALAMAYKKLVGDEPLMVLPPMFSSQLPLID